MKILILFGHPAFQKSTINKELLSNLNALEQVTLHDLYEEYPEMDIDIDREQALLLEHDCIIFQHPMFWYSTPAIFKEWQDLVLEHGWAYGSQGRALEGKLFFNAVTTGAPKVAFQRDGMQNFTVNELLAPLRQTATFCHMTWLPPFVAHGAHKMPEEKLKAYKHFYHELLRQIGNNQLDVSKALALEYLNQYPISED